MNPQGNAAESESDFEPDKRGWQQRWMMEFQAARKEVKKWQKQADRIVKRYLDERDSRTEADTRWNLFASNVETLEALLYGKTPSVDVTRRYADPQDDIARVSAQTLQRMLNSDLERNNDGYAAALEYALQDRLLAGMGNVKLRYVVEMEEVPAQEAITDPISGMELAPYVEAHERKAHEDVETDYIYWGDQLWSPARTFHQVRWWAFRMPMRRDELVRRFGAIGKQVPLNSKKASGQGSSSGVGYSSAGDIDAERQDPWGRADVWEVWDREHRQVCWFVEGMTEVLDLKTDPLQLEGFWPFPRPMVANATTSKLVPRPDFVLAQDLYDEIDSISTRITLLERAIRVAGVYDKKAPAIQRLLTEAAMNELIPVENWAMFEAGGKLEGSIAWFPIEMVVSALGTLREYRNELVSALYQITGMSDIMRGEAQQTATATEQAIKARFGSVRVQRRQDEFARFASDAQRIRGEIICKHFDAETIIERSNINNTPDAQHAQEAVEFLQSEFAVYRIQVKPESVSLTDYAALKQERTEVITSIAAYLQVAGPLMQQAPGSAPYLLQILQWLVAGIRGGSTVESILEQAISQAKKAAEEAKNNPQQAPPPDPKVVQQHLKNEGELQKTAMGAKARQQEIASETQANLLTSAVDAHFDLQKEEFKQRAAGLREMNKIAPSAPAHP
jgi:hypothetical protein